MLGINKAPRYDFRRDATMGILPDLKGGIYFFGKVSAGKTTGMISFAQKYHDHPNKKYKIFHLWGGERMEQLWWGLKSVHTKYWDSLKGRLRLNEDGPKQYQVNYLYPYTNKLPKHLPVLDGFVKSKVFQIPIKEIENEDISLVIDNISQSGVYYWREAIDKMRDKDGVAQLDKIFKDIGSSAINSILYKNFVQPLVKNKTICSYNSEFALDLEAEMKDRETITVLCLDYVEKEFRLFVMGWILRKIKEMLDSSNIRAKNIIMMNEAAQYFRATDDSTSPARFKIFRSYLSEYIRTGRRGMHMLLDAQSPHETKGLTDGQQDVTILGKMLSENDIIDATAQMLKFNLISRPQIRSLGILEPGEYIICESGKHAKSMYMFLPRTDYWRDGVGSFYKLWSKVHDTWSSTNNIKEIIENEYKIEKNKILEDEQLAKLLDEKTKETKKENKRKKKVEEEDEISDNADEAEEIVAPVPVTLTTTPIVAVDNNSNSEEEMFQLW